MLALPADVPVTLGREAAAQAAREELAKQVYREAQPGLTERVLRWLLEQANRLLDEAAGVSPRGYAGLAVLLLLLVAAVIAVRLRTGPMGRAAAETALFTDPTVSAREHRARADRHAAAQEWAEAVRERLRAVIRSLEERGVLEPRPGWTAAEAAAEAGAALPSCAGQLADAARLFGEIWYGGRPADAAADRRLRELDEAVSATRPIQSQRAAHAGRPAPPA